MPETNELGKSYNEVPYPSAAFVQTHPDRLATRARLAGLQPPPIERCRILEIGCALGENLTPLAMELPNAELIGIDLSASQIENARHSADVLGVNNVQYLVGDVSDLPSDVGEFDYIIAHGVYSWVSPEIRQIILDVYSRHLKPQGIGYISFNSFPGWRRRQAMSEMLNFHTESIQAPSEKSRHGKELLDFLLVAIPKALPDYHKYVREIMEGFGDEQYLECRLLHDLVESRNEAVWISDFQNDLAARKLAHFGDAEASNESISVLPTDTYEELTERFPNPVKREQHADFLLARTFRQALICHGKQSPRSEWQQGVLLDMEIAAYLSPAPSTGTQNPSAPSQFVDSNKRTFEVKDPFTADLLRKLGRLWPKGLAVAEWVKRQGLQAEKDHVSIVSRRDYEEILERELGRIMQLYRDGRIDLHSRRPSFATEVGEFPKASPWARWQAARGRIVTSLLHIEVRMSEIHKLLLDLADGTRSRAQLVHEMASRLSHEGKPLVENGKEYKTKEEIHRLIVETIDKRLEKAARVALFAE